MTSSEETLEKYRCKSCGAIAWTRLLRGCRTCASKELELFQEPGQYRDYRNLLHDLSRDLASLKLELPSLDHATISRKYADRLGGQLSYVCPGNVVYHEFIERLSEILQHYCAGSTSAQEALDSFAELLSRIEEYSASASRLVSEGITQWLESMGERASTENSAPYSLVCADTELVSLLLDRDSAQRRETDFDAADIDPLAKAVPGFVAKAGGSMELKCAAEPDLLYARLPFNYHVNLTEAAFQLLKDSAKLVPIVVALCRMDLPGEIVAVAETVKEVLSHVTRLREETGEVCLYEAIVMLRKRTGRYPTAPELLKELQATSVRREKCRFLDRNRDTCLIKRGDVDRILSFLHEKRVIKRVSADEWWVHL
ncbi:MAG: hypothetical protein A3G93_04150 [Nitrospinae bacterium RIFCSPLOWO2_12_FULL_45_22]|nr:MAG: hypothetical protein A3G93_04150 [Nitrospinae bacterium RIFCSPLOWO2_12_FULL_45_22]